MIFKTSDFDYALPEGLIALHPADPRDSARMLVVGEGLVDETVSSFPDYLKAGDVVVFNNTKVIPAYLEGQCRGAVVQINLNRCTGDNTWEAFVKPGRKVRAGDVISFENSSLTAEVTARQDMLVTLRFNLSGGEFWQALDAVGKMPLPPYILKHRRNYSHSGTVYRLPPPLAGGEKRLAFQGGNLSSFGSTNTFPPLNPPPPAVGETSNVHPSQQNQNIMYRALEKDNSDYQTLFASNPGAVAAPTAGLHFTNALLEKIRQTGAEICFVTLHVGGGTFLPVKTEAIEQHRMHTEWFEVSHDVATVINQARQNGGRVFAVGTTSLRALESASLDNGVVQALSTGTDIFIYPGYKFKVVDALLTNFHLPKSTLIMLTAAFSGYQRIMSVYKHAVDNKYRFYSYGDCCLLFRKTQAENT